MCFMVALLSLLLLDLLAADGHKFSFGDCPVFYEEPCQVDTVRFFLATPVRNLFRSTLHLLDHFDPIFPDHFNFSVPIKILIHGYGGLDVDHAIKNVSKAYQQNGYNVIVVDWSPLAKLPCYLTAFLNTWHVGQCIAILVVGMKKYGITPDFLHVVGFSLGAHIAGFASNMLTRTGGIPFWRITGLDPALPFFATIKQDWKLDPTDASFVDVIHTSAGSFGKIEALGDVDFYVNGGYIQPVCLDAKYPPLCSHQMSGVYFAESVASKGFLGIKCESLAMYYFKWCTRSPLAVMGEHVDPNTRGLYFVDTANSPPFALGNIYRL